MSLIIYSVGGVLAILIILGIWMFVYYRRHPEKKRETDYYNFFVIGLIWLLVGIVFMATGLSNSVFFLLGLVFLISGLANKDKWPEDKKFWLKKKR